MSGLFRCIIILFMIIRLNGQVTYPCDSEDICGCSTNSVSASRIVGGENADDATWGWVVSLSIAGTHLCGGSIISSSWILTAAHCIAPYIGSSIIVYAGSTIRWTGSLSRQVVQTIVHPNFNPTTYENDIALLRLVSPLPMDDPSVSQICIPSVDSALLVENEWPASDTYTTVVGWGRLSEDGDLPPNLRQVTLQIVDRSDPKCSSVMTDWRSQLCAGVPDGKKDACQGDSGGPLMMFTLSNQWVLVGLVSSGIGCARPDYMGVYTRVAVFIDWLRTHTNSSFSTPRNLTASDIHPPNSAISIIKLNSIISRIFFTLFLTVAGSWIGGSHSTSNLQPHI